MKLAIALMMGMMTVSAFAQGGKQEKRPVEPTVWPIWLAQWLCPHSVQTPFMWNTDNTVYANRCEDCYKMILSAEDAAVA